MKIAIDGVISHADQEPYVRISTEKGTIVQLPVAQARIMAIEMLQVCARIEADATLYKFFLTSDACKQAPAALMVDFRAFRGELERETFRRELERELSCEKERV